MKKSAKAALWSGLAFPGAGHFYLKCYVRATLLLASTVIAIFYIVKNLLDRGLITQIQGLTDKILHGLIAPDLLTVAGLLDLGPDPLSVDIASWLIMICWVAGIADSYRLGLIEDKAGF